MQQPPGGAYPQGATLDQGPSGPDAGAALDKIKEVVASIQEYLQLEPDEEDKLQGTKLLQLAQQLLAKDQADKDNAMGGQNQRILRKAG